MWLLFWHWLQRILMELINLAVKCMFIMRHFQQPLMNILSATNTFSLINVFTRYCRYLLIMMTSSDGNIFRVTGLLCGEFTGHRWIPHTKASDAELWCFLSTRQLSKQWRRWWYETLLRSSWRHCNERRLFDAMRSDDVSVKLVASGLVPNLSYHLFGRNVLTPVIESCGV